MSRFSATPGCPGDVTPSDEWDAGNMGCGELVLELRTRMLALRPSEILIKNRP